MTATRLRDIEVAYDERGRGEAIILLHGFPFNRSMWRQQIEALSSNNRVIAPDLRGHGETGVVGSAATMEEMAKDVCALMDRLDIEQARICGLSMGGYVALVFVRLYPRRVNALVLADTRPQADGTDARVNREKMAEQALRQGMSSIADAMLPKLLTRRTLDSKPEVVNRVREMITGNKPEGAAAALRGMAARRDQSDLLPKIEVPTLIIVGREDAVTPVADAEFMHRAIRNSRLEVIEEAGHVSNIERGAEFNRALSDFISTVAG